MTMQGMPEKDSRPWQADLSVRGQELFARANQAENTDRFEAARDLYEACVQDSPRFAPAWALLARCHRVIAKNTTASGVREHGRAEAIRAFEQALALEPDLPLAHSLYAQLEVDLGMAREAMARLLTLLRRHGPHADAYAGLVRALRFCGLLEPSRAAHDRAHALDPAIVTSVAHTRWQLAGYDEKGLAALQQADSDLDDPEALYYVARAHARVGDVVAAREILERVLDRGYVCLPALLGDPWLEPLRQGGRLDSLTERARAQHALAREMFLDVGGGREFLKRIGLDA